jgi:hypothetical protein
MLILVIYQSIYVRYSNATSSTAAARSQHQRCTGNVAELEATVLTAQLPICTRRPA